MDERISLLAELKSLVDTLTLDQLLYYIIGEEVLYEMMDGIKAWDENWNNLATDETNAAILEAIEEKQSDGG